MPEPGRIGADAAAELADLLHPDALRSKIELPENVQVASVPAGNNPASPPEENPVDEDDYTPPNVTVSLRVTVPADALPQAVGRLSVQLRSLIDGGEGGEPLPFVSISLDAYQAEQDGEDE